MLLLPALQKSLVFQNVCTRIFSQLSMKSVQDQNFVSKQGATVELSIYFPPNVIWQGSLGKKKMESEVGAFCPVSGRREAQTPSRKLPSKGS